MVRIANETHAEKNHILDRLASSYDYGRWRLRIMDMQRVSVHIDAAPSALITEDLRVDYRMPTAVLQANAFSFTTSETSIRGGSDIASPYSVKVGCKRGNAFEATLKYDGNAVEEFHSFSLLEIFGRCLPFYLAFRNSDTSSRMSTYVVVNPNEGCAYRCVFCSRVPHLTPLPKDYDDNISAIVRGMLASVKSPKTVRFINIITGSTPSAREDLELFCRTIDAFEAAGFSSCEFGVYSPNILSSQEMRLLKQRKVVFFTVTVETMSNDQLPLYDKYNPKKTLVMEKAIEVVKAAESEFPFVNVTLMLGYEPADELKRRLESFANATTASINHYIPRIWDRRQLDLIHPTARCLELLISMQNYPGSWGKQH